jgi:hypothetical protein
VNWLKKLKEKYMIGKAMIPPSPAYSQLGASNMAVSTAIANQYAQAQAMQANYTSANTEPLPDFWDMRVEKTEDGYVLHVSKSNQRTKKFIAKDVEELKTKIVSAMVLSQMNKG